MNEIRCTRNEPYQNSKCFGYADLGARQGCYLVAASEQDAIAIMQEMFPDDTAGFTVELWIDDFSESQPNDSKQHLYRLYRKSGFMFLGGEPLDEMWASEAEVSDANDDLVPRGYIWVKASD